MGYIIIILLFSLVVILLVMQKIKLKKRHDYKNRVCTIVALAASTESDKSALRNFIISFNEDAEDELIILREAMLKFLETGSIQSREFLGNRFKISPQMLDCIQNHKEDS